MTKINYKYIKVDIERNPRPDGRSKIPEHTDVMEKHLKRYLDIDELIHHINGNKRDNRLENLCLCKDNKFHGNIHASLIKIAYRLVESSIIKFDREINEYYAHLPIEYK
ncbi:hypothetical protein LCGC14_1772840 [marine sediment metagenome]|uniref:HNH nuclease domain-containing protein n=1 Tax=marine sediment metagenome TaxID=412755 RepID=A0A0F9JCL9_9ZZZZ